MRAGGARQGESPMPGEVSPASQRRRVPTRRSEARRPRIRAAPGKPNAVRVAVGTGQALPVGSDGPEVIRAAG